MHRLYAAIQCGTLLLIAGLLVWTWYRPRRTGQTPHCAGCDYNVSANSGERCPECGRELTLANVVLGDRIRQPWRLAAAGGAVLIMLIAAANAIWQEIRSDAWQTYVPVHMLVTRVQHPDAVEAVTAFQALKARAGAPEATPEERQALTDVCLDVLTERIRCACRKSVLATLEWLIERNVLSPADRQRALDGAARLIVGVPPIHARGSALRIYVTADATGVSSLTRCVAVRQNGVPCRIAPLELPPVREGGWDQRVFDLPPDSSDERAIEVDLEVAMAKYDQATRKYVATSEGRVRTLGGISRVVAPEQFDRELGRRFASWLRVDRVQRIGRDGLEIWMEVLETPPIAVTFDVIADINGQRVTIGRHRAYPGTLGKYAYRKVGGVRAPPQIAIVAQMYRYEQLDERAPAPQADDMLRWEGVAVLPAAP